MVFGRIIMTLSCAIVGAVFGYMLGRIIELFTSFYPGGMSMPALLAALGLMAGLVLGMLVSIMVFFARHDRYERWMRRSRHWGGRSLNYGGAYAMHGHRRFGCGRSGYTPGASSVRDALQEIDGYLSYLEDLPKDSLAPCEDKMSRLGDRLASLRASMQR